MRIKVLYLWEKNHPELGENGFLRLGRYSLLTFIKEGKKALLRDISCFKEVTSILSELGLDKDSVCSATITLSTLPISVGDNIHDIKNDLPKFFKYVVIKGSLK